MKTYEGYIEMLTALGVEFSTRETSSHEKVITAVFYDGTVQYYFNSMGQYRCEWTVKDLAEEYRELFGF